MSEHNQPPGKHLPPIGHPDDEPQPDVESDFAGEHEETAVGEEIIKPEEDQEREPESPHGWAGMEH